MPVVKGGVWTNVEDEILKASVSKYGLNQWQRVSSLLARKSAKQCKARWSEWLDPSIRKVEWSRDEDEKLLHLAKLMPTQWRTIAPIVGRTATQCLDRYNALLDEAEARDNQELGLAGPGEEASAPSADDIRKFRPGETDPDPETKPARPDAVDMDEDEKEMLSEARARLANTQGKKAKRKARERQLEDSRRIALLQKRRELKHAGINIKLTNRRKGEMDYNADIPFEKAPALGFYDTAEEQLRNERQREGIDPRKALSHKKRQGDQDGEGGGKRRKGDKEKSGSAAMAAQVAKAGQLQKIREAEQLSKRRALNLPAPQVSEAELEDIVKMGMVGENANRMVDAGENESTKGLVGNYNSINTGQPIRTPRAPPTEDRVANEIKNIRALTETKSSLLGGENTPLHESGTTGFKGINPERSTIQTPNPLATPFRGVGGAGGATPRVGQTPLRTPRDGLSINANGDPMAMIGMTPRDQKQYQNNIKAQLRAGFAALPKPKEIELETPDEPEEVEEVVELSEEDAAERDRRIREAQEAELAAELKRRTQAVQRDLPRPAVVDVDALKKMMAGEKGVQGMIATEFVALVSTDAVKHPVKGGKLIGTAPVMQRLDDELLEKARLEMLLELPEEVAKAASKQFEDAWLAAHGSKTLGLEGYGDDEVDEGQLLVQAFDSVQDKLTKDATQGNKLEKKLSLILGGYMNREKMLIQKIQEASEAIVQTKIDLDCFRTLQISEADAIPRRLESLRTEAEFVEKREKEAQEAYRRLREELDA
ncbi:pre-mRNA splicing factor component-domain-containing protein [Pyronema domesticum]|uniref:Similar to Pre-mRNA-splicing factor cef1 acc. no. Q4WHG0 n=1 Tax=Pyronema omphalodes (strain CBS 100304) TaxID=1076935 RepID=U4LUP9_PYROM|nr:pre-mRNA splicing factor component-domain-containing protein [Pyronema domesticum]CCX33902.1 Similar to Pre-mRNA-splicing factor cef1; acc. no. Q4WHG0 [Pyronema omphalodes CBS 100304]